MQVFLKNNLNATEMGLQEQFEKVQQALAAKLSELPQIIGEEAVNFSKESFKQKAWSGYTQQVWAQRKNPNKWGIKDDPSRSLLVKYGHLINSIRVIRHEANAVWIGTSTPYARAHNYGSRGVVNQHVDEFTRVVKGKQQTVKPFNRTIRQNIPQRQFIGGQEDSPYLKARLKRVMCAELNPIIRQLNKK